MRKTFFDTATFANRYLFGGEQNAKNLVDNELPNIIFDPNDPNWEDKYNQDALNEAKKMPHYMKLLRKIIDGPSGEMK